MKFFLVPDTETETAKKRQKFATIQKFFFKRKNDLFDKKMPKNLLKQFQKKNLFKSNLKMEEGGKNWTLGPEGGEKLNLRTREIGKNWISGPEGLKKLDQRGVEKIEKNKKRKNRQFSIFDSQKFLKYLKYVLKNSIYLIFIQYSCSSSSKKVRFLINHVIIN